MQHASYEHIGVDTAEHVATIEIRRGPNNFIDTDMVAEIADALEIYDRTPDVRAIVLCAEGKHFTAGLDMPKFFGPTATAKPIPADQIDPFALEKRCRKPVISVVHGITYTIGIEQMLASDIVIAADTARFCQLESKRGIAPLGGAHFRYLTRTGWGNAMYHLFLCDEFNAQEAYRCGFVQEVHPYGKHRERAMEIARLICKVAPIGLKATKAAALTYIAHGEKAAIAVIPDIQKTVFASEDFKEGIQSFVERREANFQGR